MKKVLGILGLGTLLTGCATLSGEKETEIPLSEVPEVVMNAAQQALPGIVLTGAEIEESEGELNYELEGEVDGVEYEIELSPSGEVLEIESENEDEKESS